MNVGTIFVRHKDFIIKENDHYLNDSFKTIGMAKNKVKELQRDNPDQEYQIINLQNDVNDLKMRIVSFLEDYCLPNYLILKDKEKVIKKFHHLEQAEEKLEEMLENHPQNSLEIVKTGISRPFPKYVSLFVDDYNLLKETGNIKLKNNVETTFGMEIKVFIPSKKGKKNGKSGIR